MATKFFPQQGASLHEDWCAGGSDLEMLHAEVAGRKGLGHRFNRCFGENFGTDFAPGLSAQEPRIRRHAVSAALL